MYIACLDTESTSTGRFNEILELAIYSARGELVLNSLYKPKRNRKWPHSEKVHGISPLMVQNKPHFQDCLKKIQKIFDRCQMILGFALDNDVRILEQSGITGLTADRCLDVRELFWGVYGDKLEMDFYHVPSLIKCAEFCGYVWEEGSAHSAAADAKATLYCYEVLMRQFIDKYALCDLPPEGERLTDEQIYAGWRFLHAMVSEELHRRAVEKAKGWLYLIECPLGTLLVARRKPMPPHKQHSAAAENINAYPTGQQVESASSAENAAPAKAQDNSHNHGRVLAGIYLPDYAKGYEDMYALFKPHQLPHSTGEKVYYHLTQEDIEAFKSYTNVYEG